MDILTQTGAAGKEGLVEILIVNGHSLHQRGRHYFFTTHASTAGQMGGRGEGGRKGRKGREEGGVRMEGGIKAMIRRGQEGEGGQEREG